jgi:DNA-binding transcriptional MerR regulator
MKLYDATIMAAAIGVSVDTLRAWTKAGLVPAYRAGSRGRFRYDPASVAQAIALKKAGGAAHAADGSAGVGDR